MRVRFVAILTVGAALVAACDGGGHSSRSSGPTGSISVSPPQSSSPSPSRTGPLTTGPGVLPGEKPPVMDPQAKQHNPAGALTFAEYYIKAFDWGTATSDPYLVSQISAPSCMACRRYIAELDELRSKNGHVEGGRTTVLSDRLVTGSFKAKSDYVVQFKIKEDSVVLVSPSAPPSTTAPASTSVSLVFVSWVRGRWQIIEEGAPS